MSNKAIDAAWTAMSAVAAITVVVCCAFLAVATIVWVARNVFSWALGL